MNDTISVVAKDGKTIEIILSKAYCPFRMKSFRFYADHVFKFSLDCYSISELPSAYVYQISSDDFDFVPGHFYQIATAQNYFFAVDISYLALSKEFERRYRYDGPLGPVYSKEKTSFYVFSPFSNEITLHIRKKNHEEWEIYSMKHDWDHGVFFLEIQGDYDGAMYLYERYMFGRSMIVPDPFSLSLHSNSRWSYVIDKEKIKAIDTCEENLPLFDNRMKAIIYECSVRDMTSRTDVEDKGTFSALSKTGLKDRHGMPIGMDYLSSLGVTHIQLMPVLDFQTVDEDNPFSTYNWGYDPFSYFAPEGSYASNVEDCYSRVLELKELISSFHKQGLRVVLDVVYNHVFSTLLNPFNVLCPNYFYRVDQYGNKSNGTGCGNDLESRNYMVRKMIIDSMKNLIELYDIDGFRFDLMGILDIDTLKIAYDAVHKMKKNLLFYGEGWDLCTALPSEKKAATYNADQMPFASFFNDRFRDVAKGKSGDFDLSVRGYLLGDTSYRDGFKHVMLGSAVPLAFNRMFNHAGQSLNYVECHDNHTLFDKIHFCCGEDSFKEIQQRIKLNIVATLLAAGIPFFHQGEEVAGTKRGIGNSYNSGDEINGFDYDLLFQNHDMYTFFREAIQFKKKYLYFSEAEFEEMLKEDKINFEDMEGGCLKIDYEYKGNLIHVLFNPTKNTFMYDFPKYVKLIFNGSGLIKDDENFYIRMAIINELSVLAFLEQKADIKTGKED